MEGLVVETHRQQRPKPIQDGRLVAPQPAKGVDGRYLHTLPQKRHITADIGNAIHLEQHVAIVIGEREDAARPVILETARDEAYSRRGKRG